MTRYEAAGELASRDLVSRAIVREQARTGGAGVPVDAASRSRLGARPLPDHRGRCVDCGPRPRRRIAFPWARRRITSWAACETDLWGTNDGAGPVRRRRSRVHRRPRRQSAGQQLAARRPGLRRARGAGHAAAGRRRFHEVRMERFATRSNRPRRRTACQVEEHVRGPDVELGGAVARGGAAANRHRSARRMVCGARRRSQPHRRPRHRRPLDGAGRLAPRGNARLPRPRRLSGQR